MTLPNQAGRPAMLRRTGFLAAALLALWMLPAGPALAQSARAIAEIGDERAHGVRVGAEGVGVGIERAAQEGHRRHNRRREARPRRVRRA